MNLWLVVADGYNNDYGSYIFCLGIFDSVEKAKEIKNKCTSIDTTILEIPLNQEFPLSENPSTPNSYTNEIFLGGYVE